MADFRARPHRAVRDMIAKRLEEAHNAPYFVGEEGDSDAAFFRSLADAVMKLFSEEVTVQGRSRRSGVWWANEPRPDARRFVLYTVPTAEGGGEADHQKALQDRVWWLHRCDPNDPKRAWLSEVPGVPRPVICPSCGGGAGWGWFEARPVGDVVG
jgi:hypothetical protein